MPARAAIRWVARDPSKMNTLRSDLTRHHVAGTGGRRPMPLSSRRSVRPSQRTVSA